MVGVGMSITIDEFRKVEIKVGKIISVEPVEGSEKLLKLQVDFGAEIGERQILSGIAKWYMPEELTGKKLPFVVNLEPRKMMGLESQGMLVAADGPDGAVLLEPIKDIPEGSTIV
jgi:methionine--tRNA ligase beta chain